MYLPNKRLKRFLGFTLIELLVAALMAGIFLAATAGIIVRTLQTDRIETAISEVQSEMIQSLDFISKDLEGAIYVYNDAANVLADGRVVGGADGIPDLEQVLWRRNPGDVNFIPRPLAGADQWPVLAFWKLVPIPEACFDAGALRPAVENYRELNRVYQLVIYYLRRNVAGDAIQWPGLARITRKAYSPFDTSGGDCIRKGYFPDDPDVRRFFAWPSVGNETIVQTVARIGAPIPASESQGNALPALVANVYFNQGTALPPIALNDNSFCLLPGEADNFQSLYALGGIPHQSLGFYACVRRSGGGTAQDVRLFIRGSWLPGADPRLFTRAFAGTANDDELNQFIIANETQIFIRTVIDRVIPS